MAIQNLDFGTAADGDGEYPYTAWRKVQANFEDLYALMAALGLNSLGDVIITSPTVGQVLKFDGGSWVNGTDSAPAAVVVADGLLSITGSSDASKVLKFEVDGFTTATTRIITVPNASGTMVLAAATQTLTNKTLEDASSVIAGPGSMWTEYFSNPGTAKVHRLNRLLLGPVALASSDLPMTTPDWIEDLISNSTAVAQFGVSSATGQLAIVAGSRTKDYRDWLGDSSAGSQAALFIAINDDLTPATTPIACSADFRAYRVATCNGITECAEFEVYNNGSVVDLTPFTGVNSGSTFCALITSEGSASASAGVVFSAGDSTSKFRRGIVFLDAALDTAVGSGGNGVAIEFARGQSIRWVNSGGGADAQMWGAASGFYFNNHVFPVSGSTYQLGAAGARWSNLFVDQIQLGADSDTTLARVSAGVVSIEGNNILTANLIGTSVQAYGADITAIEALSTTGFSARTASNTWALRSIANGTGISVTNGDGVSGNPSVAIDTAVVPRLASANTFTAGITVTLATQYATPLNLISTYDANDAGPLMQLDRIRSGTPANGDSLGLVNFRFKNSAGATKGAASIQAQATVVSSGSERGSLLFQTESGSGFPTTALGIAVGVYIGSATDQGAGTLNIQADYYRGGTKVVGARDTGWTAWTGTGSKATKAVSTATTADCAAAIKSMLDAMISHGLIGA